MQRTVELATFYDPDMAFFLAITPWPYADLYNDVKDHIATRDYRKYNLVEPVIKPVAMTLDEVREQLFRGFREFYQGKMSRFQTMPEWKQKFMRTLMKLLMEHSYLRDQMKGLGHPSSAAGAVEVQTKQERRILPRPAPMETELAASEVPS
jgi:anaerobic magnesium-protoporphyrin IX monomethyl ester cyclase